MCDLVCKIPNISYSTTTEKFYTRVNKETNVCEAKPQISQDEIKISTVSKKEIFAKNKISTKTTQISFVDNKSENSKYYDTKNAVCVDPANLIDQSKIHVDSSKFTLDKTNTKVMINLGLEVKDKNGLNNAGNDDISGKIKNGEININHEVFDKALFSMKGYKSQEGKRSTEIKNVIFDKSDNSYVFDIKVTQNATKSGIPVFWDNFKVKFKTDNNGKLSAKVDENWIFDSMIIDKLKDIVKNKVKENIPEKFRNISLDIKKNKNELVLTPQIKDLSIPINGNKSVSINHIEGEKAKFNIDSQGNININLNIFEIKGSSSTEKIYSQVVDKEDEAEIDLKMGLDKNSQKQVYAKGKLAINIDEKETSLVKLGSESLGNYLKSAKIINDFSVYLKEDDKKELAVDSKNYVYLEDAKIGDGNRSVNLATNLELKFNSKSGISLESIEDKPESDLNISTSNNGIETIIGGSNFFNQMKKDIKEAKESVNLETFELKDDYTSNALTYMLVKKSAGLNPDKNKTSISKESPKGIDVKIIFNSWQGHIEEGEKTEKMIEKNISKVKDEINQSTLSKDQKKQAIENIDKKFNHKFFTDGLLRSDHRKAFIVDGLTASVGGVNMNDFHLANDSAHDIMVKVAGPEVRNVQKEFLENWFEFNNLSQPKEEDWSKLLKSETDLNKNLSDLQKKGEFKSNSKVGVLVTDDHQTDISKGILKLIDESKKEIYIEQAFFTDSKINDKLKEAMKRGVNVNIVLAKDSLSSHVFNDANLYSAYQLLKEQKNGSAGKVNLFYYEDKGNASKYIHTKAISADGDKAIIGSANMVGRSLDSPFQQINSDGTKQNIMYNKEMSLYLEGEESVGSIDEKLFKTDIKNKSKQISPEEMEEMVKKAGGESELRKKFLMAFVA